VAVGDNGSALLLAVTGGSRTISTGIDKTLRSVAMGRVLVAVGDAGTIVTSSDGQAWEQHQPGRWLDFDDVIWTGTTFLACANVTSGVMPAYLSKDGITWTPASSVEDSYGIWGFDRAAWSGSKAIVSATAFGAWWNGEHQYARVYASEDLLHWRIVRETHESYFSGTVVWMNDQFVVVCSDEVLRSSDGETWVSEPTSAYDLLSGFISVTVQAQTAYGISQDGAIYESNDLRSWQYLRSMSVPGVKMDINWTGNEFLVCGYYTPKHVWWSSDLSTWEAMDPNTGFDLLGAASSPERWVVVGRNGTIRTRER
jgi:hypothetical protein